MPPNPDIVAARHLEARVEGTHYRVDRDYVNRALRHRSRRELLDEASHYGFVTHKVLEYVPLSQIHPEAVWRPDRIGRIREALAAGRALPPIDADIGPDGKYHIADGIHRYNASVEAGFSHIPVLRTVVEETPERYVPPEPEHPKLSSGTIVRLREPPPGTAPWAIVIGYLGRSNDRGTTRHRYELDGFEHGTRSFVGDYADDRFDVIRSPPEALRRRLTAE